jgi:hypothetical protein
VTIGHGSNAGMVIRASIRGLPRPVSLEVVARRCDGMSRCIEAKEMA